MKNITILALLCVVLYSSCGNDDDGNTGDCQESCLAFTIDGNAFRTDAAVGILNDFSAAKTLTLGNFNSPTFSELSTISIAIDESIMLEETSYTFDKDCDASVTICGVLAYAEVDTTDPSNTKSYTSGDAILNITFSQVDLVSGGLIVGTFSGEVENVDDPTDRKTVTNGRFNIRIN